MIKQVTVNIFDQTESRDPVITDNPARTPYSFLNTSSGELFICMDNTPDNNVWKGQLGTEIS